MYAPGRTMQAAESLERFLAESFPSHKRFGIEGCDALVPGLHAIMQVRLFSSKHAATYLVSEHVNELETQCRRRLSATFVCSHAAFVHVLVRFHMLRCHVGRRT
jgi:hypothetical protein